MTVVEADGGDASPDASEDQAKSKPPTIGRRIWRFIWRFGRDPIAVLTLGLFILGGIQLEIGRRTARAQLRPYVQAKQAVVEWHSEGAEVVFTISNDGATPATFFEISGVAEVLANGSAREIPEWTDGNAWGALGSGAALTAGISFPGILRTELSPAFDNYLSVRGAVRYGTIFGEVFETQFDFMARRVFREEAQTMQRATGKHRAFQKVR